MLVKDKLGIDLLQPEVAAILKHLTGFTGLTGYR
jgi:hypothetical protein